MTSKLKLKPKSPPEKPITSQLPSTSTWEATKIFFKRSESIFLARMIALGGTATTFVGGMDFSPLWSLFQTGTDFTQKQLIFMGIAIVGTGVSLEIARRRNASAA